MTTPLPFDILVSMSSYLSPRALLSLARTSRTLTEPLTKAAVRATLIAPSNEVSKPITHAIEHGDLALLSLSLATLDSLHPRGWNWSALYTGGVGAILALAAAHNLESLKFLLERYPLWPASSTQKIPSSVIDHRLYTLGDSFFSPSLVNVRNTELVRSAIQAQSYSCASFLLREYEPPLFPHSFKLNGDPLYFSSARALEFLIAHNADLGVDALHSAVASGDSTDSRVLDILLGMGYNIDAPRHSLANHSTGQLITPLNLACERLQPRSVQLLLQAGANPNGVGNSSLIRKVRYFDAFQYFSPSPIIAILLSSRWFALGFRELGERFIFCFQSLRHYSAEIPSHFIEVLLFRTWVLVCKQLMAKPGFILPSSADQPNDLNKGVRSLLYALEGIDVAVVPWDRVCELASDTTPAWREKAQQTTGKAQLLKFFRYFQDHNGDLPGPAQVQRPLSCAIPDRYCTNDSFD